MIKELVNKDNNMLKELIKIANELDKRGLVKEADKLDEITKEAGIPLLAAAAAVLLCWGTGCVEVSKEELAGATNGDIDWEFEYDENDNAIGVHAVGRLAGKVTEQDNHPKFPTPNVSLAWPCENWEVLRDTAVTTYRLEVGKEGMLVVTMAWQKDGETGYLVNEEMGNAEIFGC
jgi:hypothetical protein